MKIVTLQTLIDQIGALNAKLSGVDNDEATFTAEREAIIAGADYSSASVTKITEFTTRLLILPSARTRLQVQLGGLEEELRSEIHQARADLIQDVHGGAEKQLAIVAEALHPFSDTPARAMVVAEQTDAVKNLRADGLQVSSVDAGPNANLVGSAMLLLNLWAEFSKNGKLAR